MKSKKKMQNKKIKLYNYKYIIFLIYLMKYEINFYYFKLKILLSKIIFQKINVIYISNIIY